jgi:hypothetical protein
MTREAFATTQAQTATSTTGKSLGGGLKAVPSTCDTNQFWYLGDFIKSGTSYTWTNKNLCTNIGP